MGKSERELLSSMDADELVKWQAYDRYIEPVGMQTRLLAELIALVFNATSSSNDRLTAEQVLGLPGRDEFGCSEDFEEDEFTGQSEEELDEIFNQLNW